MGEARYEGRVPIVTCVVFVFPLRTYVTATLSPGALPATAAVKSSGLWIAWPSKEVITSPAFSPAAAAGEPLLT